MATFNEKFPWSVTLLEQRNRYFSRRGRSSDVVKNYNSIFKDCVEDACDIQAPRTRSL